MDARWVWCGVKYRVLLAVAQAANSYRDLSKVLEIVAGALQELVPIDLIGVVTHERGTVRARGIHFRRAPRSPGESHEEYVVRFSESCGGTGDSWKHTGFLRDAMERDRRTLVLDHVSTDPRLGGAGMKQAGVPPAHVWPMTRSRWRELASALTLANRAFAEFGRDRGTRTRRRRLLGVVSGRENKWGCAPPGSPTCLEK